MKKTTLILLSWLCFFTTFLGVFEIAYRYYWFDFYGHIFTNLNVNYSRQKSKQNLLVFGDSFGAQPNNYVQLLQDSSGHQVYNLSIPGTSGLDHAIFALKKIKEHHPDTIIFQLYIGNDLLDVSPPINWKELSFVRNTYWLLSKYFISLKYLNFEFGQLRAFTNSQLTTPELTAHSFSVEYYSERTKLYLKANPDYIQQSVLVTKPMSDSFIKLMNAYRTIISCVPPNTSVFFLIIPHCTQTHNRYAKQYQELGMKSFDSKLIQQLNYPFVSQIQTTFPNAHIINPLGYFQELEQSGLNLYFKNDPHLNKTGQKMLYNFSLKCLR
jgi:hypothetical protein